MLRNGLEPWHLLIMVAVVLLLFGSKKLPDMARGLGRSMRILKAETRALREDEAQGGVRPEEYGPEPERPRAVESADTTRIAEAHDDSTRARSH